MSFTMKVTPEQREAIEVAANKAGLEASTWAREVLLVASGAYPLTEGYKLRGAAREAAKVLWDYSQ